MNAIVHLQFITGEVDAGKQGILLEGIVRKQAFLIGKQITNGFTLLVVAAQQEENLGLKGIPFPVRVEI